MVILLQCSDRVGLVADIAAVMAAANLNIISMKEFVNVDENRFYIRLEVQGDTDLEKLQLQIKANLPKDTEINIRPYEKRK
ncbi:ACT domain-containing protein [Niabella ginsengisoli]|uniref:ACT domain-containing protein n=1 Tax=Niabella ginsengisoli TaxID=522298 RepID=A0ABS9SH68_9BACT|nr:ACT domain-containing protein [Niabella ginsengisoli]MCH5597666.1 ACT domain-containing protein [Niabella ginsengisoli]